MAAGAPRSINAFQFAARARSRLLRSRRSASSACFRRLMSRLMPAQAAIRPAHRGRERREPESGATRHPRRGSGVQCPRFLPSGRTSFHRRDGAFGVVRVQHVSPPETGALLLVKPTSFRNDSLAYVFRPSGSHTAHAVVDGFANAPVQRLALAQRSSARLRSVIVEFDAVPHGSHPGSEWASNATSDQRTSPVERCVWRTSTSKRVSLSPRQRDRGPQAGAVFRHDRSPRSTVAPSLMNSAAGTPVRRSMAGADEVHVRLAAGVEAVSVDCTLRQVVAQGAQLRLALTASASSARLASVMSMNRDRGLFGLSGSPTR